MLLIEQAVGSTSSKSDIITASRWTLQMPDVQERFAKLQNFEESTREDSNELVFDSYAV